MGKIKNYKGLFKLNGNAEDQKHFRKKYQVFPLSQSALAEKADISVTFLSNIERGKMFPKVETLSRLTESLDVSVFELFRADLVHEDNKEMINRFSKDIVKNGIDWNSLELM